MSFRAKGKIHTIGLVHVVPRTFSTKNVFRFLLLHHSALEVPLVKDKLVRTCPAFEAVGAYDILVRRIFRCDLGYREHIVALGANYGLC